MLPRLSEISKKNLRATLQCTGTIFNTPFMMQIHIEILSKVLGAVFEGRSSL
jgi:hypothetical protein